MAANSHSLDLERGSSQYASVADTAPLSITGNISLAAWVKLESSPAGLEFAIAAKYSGTGDQRSYVFYFNGNALAFAHDATGNSPTNLQTSFTPSTGQWYHIAVTYNVSTGTAKFYVNGAQQGSDVTGGEASIFNSTAAFSIGAYGATPQSFFDGLIDEVVVTSDVISSQELADLYAGWDATEKLDNIAGYWKLNNNYTDSSGNGATLTAANSPAFSTDVPFSNYATSTNGSFLLNFI